VVNQLLPYPRYEEWRDAAQTTLDVYRQLVAPDGIDRLGMRYINQVRIPSPTIRMEEYFRVYAEVPPELGGSHGPFMLQLLMQPVCPGHQLTLTLGMNPAEPSGTTNILLDLYDLLPLGGRDAFGEFPRLLDEAHANIVHTFEHTVTDASRKLFGEVTHE
jgi:uncharacterized protein (TIGR04255 family)